MNIGAIYNQAAAPAGSPGRWEQATPLQREAVEVMAARAVIGAPTVEEVAQAAIDHLTATYGLVAEPGAAETYLPVARALVEAARVPASAWADRLPTVFPGPDDGGPQSGAWLLPEDAYHADPLRQHGQRSVNASTLRRILAPGSPALVRYAADHPETRDAWDLGTVTHALTLGTGSEIVEVAHDSWRSQAAKGERDAARDRGAVALLSKDLRAAAAMAAAVRVHPLAGGVLRAPGASEVTLVWREPVPGTDRQVWARAMVDRLTDPAVAAVAADLKTATGDLDAEALTRKSWDLGYHQATEWYSRGVRAVLGVEVAVFLFLYVRKTPPHLVHVVELDADLLTRARAQNDAALAAWDECVRTDRWPGPGQDTEPTLIGAPRWAR